MSTTKKPDNLKPWAPRINYKPLDLKFPDKRPGLIDNTSQHVDDDPRLLPNIVKSQRNRVLVVCPYSSEDLTMKDKHIRYALKCFEDSLARSEAPMLNQIFHSHTLGGQGQNSLQRDIGLIVHLSWISVSDIIAVYTDYGLSPGMQTAINVAMVKAKRVEYRTIGARV